MTERVENLRQEVKAETQKGLGAVGDECRKRHQEIIMEMERKAEEKTKELGERIEKQKGETQRGLAEVIKEMEQIREEFGELSLGTQEGRERARFKQLYFTLTTVSFKNFASDDMFLKMPSRDEPPCEQHQYPACVSQSV